MKKTIKKMSYLGMVFTFALGSLFHFLFEWLGENSIVGTIVPINESIWEHTKLIALPMVLFAIIEYFVYGRDFENFIPVRIISIFIGIAITIVGFYAYSGVLGKDYMLFDILLFFIAIFFAYNYSTKNFGSSKFVSERAKTISIIAIGLLFFLFIIFTFLPPEIGLFRDPQTFEYGLI